MRRALPAAILLLVLAIAWWLSRRPAAPSSLTPPSNAAPAQADAAAAAAPSPRAPLSAQELEANFPIVAPLNQPGSTIQRDLETLDQVFEAWRTNFPREGNPVGENADITAALAGDNPLGFALLPKSHPAINARGDLCDRWGTPFRFHQLSGEQMEIRSAGPDRKFATDDDALWTPP